MRTLAILALLILVPTVSFAQEAGLPVGTQAPDFKDVTYDGQEIHLAEIYKQKPVVLVFYRGGWCRYCNLQLQEVQQNIKEFNDAGAELIAISVDTPESAGTTVESKKLDFNVISNPTADLLKLYNVVFYVPKDLSDMYKEKYNIDLEAASGRRDGLIAIPATYVINKEGTIIFSSANVDYQVRPSLNEILEAVREINKIKIGIQ